MGTIFLCKTVVNCRIYALALLEEFIYESSEKESSKKVTMKGILLEAGFKELGFVTIVSLTS